MNADEEISYFFNDKEFKYKAISMEESSEERKKEAYKQKRKEM